MTCDLKGKTALIAGASKGIGKATAISLSEMGARIYGVARGEKHLKQLREHLQGNDHRLWSLDLSKNSDIEELGKKLSVHSFPHIVIAGLYVRRSQQSLLNSSSEFQQLKFTENIDYLLSIMKNTIKFQRKENFGRWIGVSSMSAKAGIRGQALYNAQKSAMEGLFRTLAVEEGKHNITANIVSPGFIETEGTTENYSEPARKMLNRCNVIGRAGKPEEVAQAIAFLASEDASYITGIDLPVCGGANLAWGI